MSESADRHKFDAIYAGIRINGDRIKKGSMKRLILAPLAVLALALAGGCGSSSSDSSSSSGGDSTKTVSCASLVGKPVGSATGDKLDNYTPCEDDGNIQVEVGSFGCYPKGDKQDGLGYYVGGSKAFYFGRPGGKWMTGPLNLSTSQMAKKIGC